MKKLLLLLIISPLFLTGCLGDLIEFACLFSEDETHCYQSVAIQESEPLDCEKVLAGDWVNSNPPKDKCYLLIAENTGDPSICDDIVGGPGSYTREGCIASVLDKQNPENCVDAIDETACRTSYILNGRSCGFGWEYKQEQCQSIKTIEEQIAEEELAESGNATENGLSNAEQADIDTVVDALTGRYGELLQNDIDSETNPGRKAGLEAYQNFLGQTGETVDQINTNFETLSDIRRIFLDSYDPGDDIRNMSVATHLDPGFFDQLSDRLLGAEPKPTGLARENADAENSLTIYAVMLEQQAENDFLQEDRLSRLGGVISSKFRDEITGKVVDGAKEVAEGLAGTAFIAVDQVASALQAYIDEAQHQQFLGLARAYNRRRAALEKERPNVTPEENHAAAVEQLKQDPYRDNTQLAFLKFDNILKNTDCQDSSNPLCIDSRVFWVAMDKTFRYNNK